MITSEWYTIPSEDWEENFRLYQPELIKGMWMKVTCSEESKKQVRLER